MDYDCIRGKMDDLALTMSMQKAPVPHAKKLEQIALLRDLAQRAGDAATGSPHELSRKESVRTLLERMEEMMAGTVVLKQFKLQYRRT